MSKIKLISKIITVGLIINFFNELSANEKLQNIYVFGDSHASFNHRMVRDAKFISADNVAVLFKIRAFSARTMHRVGRDGLAGLDVTTYGVQSGDIVIFNFGEVDCRNHIGRQRDNLGRTLNEIIDTLAIKYIATIMANYQLIPNVTYAVMSILPPSDLDLNAYGNLADRIKITKLLNQRLMEECSLRQLTFINIYDLLCDANEALRHELSDGTVQVGPNCNQPIKERVVQTLLIKKVLK